MPRQITQNGGYAAVESEAGYLYYFKYHQDGIWQLSPDSEEETRLVDNTNIFAYDSLYLSKQGMYYISTENSDNNLSFYDLKNHQLKKIMPLDNPFSDFAISKDSTAILFPKLLNQETAIKILERR